MAFDFYSRASCEARHISLAQTCALGNFYSRASCEARQKDARGGTRYIDFYSRASCEARPSSHIVLFGSIGFLLTRLMRGATADICRIGLWLRFLLTRLMRGATRAPEELQRLLKISTHAPHARRDLMNLEKMVDFC